jgi:hypothetical protein
MERQEDLLRMLYRVERKKRDKKKERRDVPAWRVRDCDSGKVEGRGRGARKTN